MTFNNPHAGIDAENRERDRRVAGALRTNPEWVRVAQQNLRRWMDAEKRAPHPTLLEWQDLLEFLTPAELADFLESRTPKAERLRQSSPFLGSMILDAAEVASPVA